MLLLIPMLAFAFVAPSPIRYTFLPSRYNGLFEKEFRVGRLDECSIAAQAKNKIGFRLTIQNEEKKEMTCAFLRQFSRFDSRTVPNDYDFILDTKASDNFCRWDTVRNGLQMYTAKMVQCPPGQTTVDIKKGKHLCCPPGQKVMEEKNGMAYCCPPSKQLKGIVNGKSVCCDPRDNYKNGTAICCQGDKHYIQTNGVEHCCRRGLVASKSSNGNIGCCPSGRSFQKPGSGRDHCCPSGEEFFKSSGNIDYCCLKGQTLKDTKGDKAICCDQDKVYKEMLGSRVVCCKPSDNYKYGSGKCCPSGHKYNKNNGVENCCKPDKPYAVKSAKGGLGCCGKAYDILHWYTNTSDGKDYVTCCAPHKRFDIKNNIGRCV
ncbi:hypothetical protein QR680_004129 [Steinernema hermaphroditum]|uniref:Uncharacterized protein n=1 Tax=Steinernema hermaphroditum TaxID=289476 RepID=A0AA39LTI5_9BILA|nr:hypothetical protein QR680_004129 [Steinernema hermaphroditum]